MTKIHNRVIVFGDDSSSSIASFATSKWSLDWFKGKSTGNPWVFTIRYIRLSG